MASYDFNDSVSEATSSFRTTSAYDFVKGFITGQIALLSLLFFIVRFLFFRSVGPVTPSSNSIRLESSAFASKSQKKNSVSNFPSLDSDSALLERLFGLDHQLLKLQATKSGNPEILISDESARWLTFMLSKVIFDPFRARIHENSSLVITALQDKLKEIQDKKSSQFKALKYLEIVQIKSVGIGNFYPSIDSYQLIYNPESERCAFRMKCSWQDALALDVESALSLAGLVALPFSVSVKVKNIKFTAQLQSSNDAESFELTCLPDDYLLIDLEVGSLLGHRTKLKDLPKIKNAIVEAVKKILSDTIISPKCIKIPLPKLQDNFIWASENDITGRNEQKQNILDSNANDVNTEILNNTVITEEIDNPIDIGVSAASLNGFSLGKSLISDESEPMNIFIDSRYDFDDEIETHTLISSTKTK